MLDPSDVIMEVTLWEQKGSWQNPLKKWIIENQTFHAQSEDRLDHLEEKPTHGTSWVGYGKGRFDLQGIF